MSRPDLTLLLRGLVDDEGVCQCHHRVIGNQGHGTPLHLVTIMQRIMENKRQDIKD